MSLVSGCFVWERGECKRAPGKLDSDSQLVWVGCGDVREWM